MNLLVVIYWSCNLVIQIMQSASCRGSGFALPTIYAGGVEPHPYS